MRPPSAQPLFLARESYRRRRLIDAIRLVPVLGAILFMVPALSAAGQLGMTFRGGLYLFGSWLLLIVLAALLEHRLHRMGEAPPPAPGAGPEGTAGAHVGRADQANGRERPGEARR